MYSRYEDTSKRSFRLPEHYGGSAFSQQPTAPAMAPKREVPRTLPRDGVGEKVSPAADRLLRAEMEEEQEAFAPVEVAHSNVSLDVEQTLAEEKKQVKPPVAKNKATAPAINFEGLRRLLGGEEGDGDRDRLLLLGLILLLSRTDGDSDVLLWLSLLLLCG